MWISVLQLFPTRSAADYRVKTRWGWLFVSLALMGLAGFFLYPSVVSLTETERAETPAPASKPAPPATADLPMATPIPAKSNAPPPPTVRRARVDKPTPVKTVAG